MKNLSFLVLSPPPQYLRVSVVIDSGGYRWKTEEMDHGGKDAGEDGLLGLTLLAFQLFSFSAFS